MSIAPRVRVVAAVMLASVFCQVGLTRSAAGAQYVVFKIWNDTKVPVTQLYDKDSRQGDWGINDLQDISASNPFTGKVHPVQPGHYFYIRLEQNSYAHCPGMRHDVRLVFANGDVKVLSKVDVCKYDVHVNRT
jgi:hypothetical protein